MEFIDKVKALSVHHLMSKSVVVGVLPLFCSNNLNEIDTAEESSMFYNVSIIVHIPDTSSFMEAPAVHH